jgi:hypothetical protein
MLSRVRSVKKIIGGGGGTKIKNNLFFERTLYRKFLYNLLKDDEDL